MQHLIFDSVTRITFDCDMQRYMAFDASGKTVCSAQASLNDAERHAQYLAFDQELDNLLSAGIFSENPDYKYPRQYEYLRDIPAHLEWGECDLCHFSGDLCPECGLCPDCCHNGDCGAHPQNPDHAFIPLKDVPRFMKSLGGASAFDMNIVNGRNRR